MALKKRYLKELSDLFVQDLKRSEYYRDLPEDQQRDLDHRLAEEASRGLYPLVPGAAEDDLERLSRAIREKLNVSLPSPVVDILRQVDGFVENGVSLYGVDGELRDDKFDSGPGILAENIVNWSGFAEAIQKYLFLGDSDLWYFAIDLRTGQPIALQRSTLQTKHDFSTVEEMVNDMMQQALGDFADEPYDTEDETEDSPTDFRFSRS